MSKYKELKERARATAIALQQTNFNNAQSWQEVAENSDKVYRLGKRYGLIKEFRNEGLL